MTELCADSARLGGARTSIWKSRLVEFALVGGFTPILFPLSWWLRSRLGLDRAELAVGFLAFHGALLVNDPHFSVTYLLFYENLKERAFGSAFPKSLRFRYWVAGLVLPVLLGAWIVLGIAACSARSLGLLFELMFFLVGWHYVKQGYGAVSVLCARRGVRFTHIERKLLLAHCFAGFAYAWASPAGSAKEVEEKGVVYTALAHPAWLELVTRGLFAASALALLAVLVRKWRREGRVPPLSPLMGLLVTVWLWTVYSSLDPLVLYVIPALHSLQYLYFVWLLKRDAARELEGPPSFGRPAAQKLAALAVSALGLGFFFFHGAPALLDGTLVQSGSPTAAALGKTPYFAALFAFVNIHHYFMDAVIWRRENPDLRFLVRSARSAPELRT